MGVSLDEAEAEVLSWLDPRLEPVVVMRQYIRSADLPTSPLLWGRHPYAGRWPEEPFGETLIVVAVSKRHWCETADCDPDADTPERHTVVGVFDAVTGEIQGADNFWGASSLSDLPDFGDALQVQQQDEARVTVTPRDRNRGASNTAMSETASPSPPRATPAPAPGQVPLTWTNMPADLAATFRAYPLAPGSTWTWRYSSETNRVWYEAQLVTETVEAAWLEGDHAVVHSLVERQSLKPVSPLGTGKKVDGTDTVQRYIDSGVIVGSLKELKDAESILDRQYTHYRGHSDTPFGPEGIAMEGTFEMFPRAGVTGRTGVTGGPTEVTAVAGTFSDCWEYGTIGGAGIGGGRTFCPGVGIVRYLLGWVMGGSGGADSAELQTWHPAELPAK